MTANLPLATLRRLVNETHATLKASSHSLDQLLIIIEHRINTLIEDCAADPPTSDLERTAEHYATAAEHVLKAIAMLNNPPVPNKRLLAEANADKQS